ncbi:MAG: hypothetical protein UW87_C0015G0015 [Candidatus Moranbacteria bacterium GW2011_GWC2_45_10]|nr:MAG: hypothetical protein UW87_C0015G0015 [Candidatus Moranbacteria bacterium GW2011_GWC2_45_10]
MLNIFKKSKKTDEEKKAEEEAMKNIPGVENMGMLQKMAMKKVMKMSPEERNKLMAKMLEPKNIQKNKKQILEMLEGMEKSGQMNKHQVFEAKKRLGLL